MASLGQNLFHDLPVNIGQPKITARVTVGQFLVVKPHEVEDCRVQVVHADAIFVSYG